MKRRLFLGVLWLRACTAFCRGGFDVDIVPETEKIVASITDAHAGQQVAYVGTGRSPTAVVATLQNQNQMAMNLPLSSFGSWFETEAVWSQRNTWVVSPSEETLFRIMDRLIPKSYFERQKLVLVDLAHSGASLANFAVALRKYARLRGLPQPTIELQYLGEPIDEIKTLLQGEKIPFKIHAISPDLQRIMGADGFSSVSEYGRLMISNGRALYWPGTDSEKGLRLGERLDELKPRGGYGVFRESLRLHRPAPCEAYKKVVAINPYSF